jgi:hypothetical protein
MDIKIFFDGIVLLIGLALIVASFVSKTIVWGQMVGGKPQTITWFGRTFLFLAGSVCVYRFGVAILSERRVTINPLWRDVGLPLSEVVLFVLALSLAVLFLIASIRDSWLRRSEGTRIQLGIPMKPIGIPS